MSNKKQTSEAIAAVSVIIPIYNVEKYLSTCVYSVLKQSLKDIEVILVDDGSPDNCGQIADSIARKDARVKVIHRNNGGLGAARNSGLDCARGEYVCFIDSDDWIDNNMLEELHTNAVGTNADIVFSGMRIVASGNVIDEYDHPFHGRILDNKGDIFAFRRSFFGSLPEKVKIDPTPVSVCSALYSLSFIRKHHLRFQCVRSEDIFFNTQACRAANRVSFADGAFYNYRKDNQPYITRTFNPVTIDTYLDMFQRLIELASEESDDACECLLRVKRSIIDNCRVLIGRICAEATLATRKTEINRLISSDIVRTAVVGYPGQALPFGQRLFLVALKTRSINSLIALVTLRSLLPLNGNRGNNES